MNDDPLIEGIARAICLNDEACKGACWATAEDALSVVRQAIADAEQERDAARRLMAKHAGRLHLVRGLVEAHGDAMPDWLRDCFDEALEGQQ